MLKNKLNTIPFISLVRSDKVFDALLRDILEGNSDEPFDALLNSVKDYYPNAYRLDEIELSLQQESLREIGISYSQENQQVKGLDYSLEFLENLFDEFLLFDGSKIYVKEEKLEEYTALITKIDPYMMIGYKLAKVLHEQKINSADLELYIRHSSALGYRVQSKEYADNHLHLSGTLFSAFNLMYLFNSSTNEMYFKTSYIDDLPRLNEFSLLNQHTYTLGQMAEIAKRVLTHLYIGVNEEDELLSNVCQDIQQIVDSNLPLNATHLSVKDLSSLRSWQLPSYNEAEKLQDLVVHYFKKDRYDKSYLAQMVLLFHLQIDSSCKTRQNLIKLYVHVINILRSYMLMSQNRGLAHFSEFSRSKIRQAFHKNDHVLFNILAQSGTTHVNAKFNWPDSAPRMAKDIYRRNYWAKQTTSPLDASFCFSIAKKADAPLNSIDGISNVRFLKLRKEIIKKVKKLDEFLRSVRYKEYEPSSGSSLFSLTERPQHIDITKQLVNVDAVGKETHTPPEVFAPYYRFLRVTPKGLIGNIYLGNSDLMHHKQLLFTLHAGEDFNHLISGMRRIDETVLFYDMRNKDRLGHALALGVSPRVWLDNVKEIILKKEEYYDNCVWMAERLHQLSRHIPDMHYYQKEYEQEAHKMFRELYGEELPNFTPQLIDMVDAWKQRQYCPIAHFDSKDKSHTDVGLLGSYKKTGNNNAEKIYEAYHSAVSVKEEGDRVMLIEKERVEKELELLEGLQDFLISEYSQKGIIIETNPSSNIFIGNMDVYKHHPIFRFHPPKSEMLQEGEIFNRFGLRNGLIRTCVNSDDPAIFATTLQNEFQILKRTAIEAFDLSEKDADDWCELLRIEGINIYKESVDNG